MIAEPISPDTLERIETIELVSLRVVDCGPLKDDLILFGPPNGQARPVTILAGANGSGKTTVLEIIAALWQLLEPDDAPIPGILARTGYAQTDLRIDGIPFSICYGVRPADADVAAESMSVGPLDRPALGTPKALRAPKTVAVTNPGAVVRGLKGGATQVAPKQGLSRASQSQVANRLLHLIAEQQRLPLPFAPYLADSAPHEEPWLPSLLYFPHYRVLLPTAGTRVVKEDTQYRWLHRYKTVGSFSGSLDSYLVWLEYAEPEVYEQARAFLDSLNLGGKRFSIERRSLRAVVTTPDGHRHGLDLLSSGEQNILVMMLELVRRLTPHSIVMIDEIENSLHRAYQHFIAERLLWLQKQVPFQLIVTTHSTAFLETFGSDSTLILTEF